MNNKWEEGNKGDKPSTQFEAWGVYVPVCLCLPWARVGAAQLLNKVMTRSDLCLVIK